MDIDIHFALAYYTTNINIFEFNWKTFGHALWYDARTETYHEAMERVKDIVWEEIYTHFPNLRGTDVRFIESGELPIINEKER